MKNLIVSVVIPGFNSQKELDRCLKALAGQSLDQKKFEVLVVDNGSSPPLQKSAVQPNHVRLLREPRPGSYAARNRGICATKGEIVAFTDSDCVPEGAWLEKGVESINKGPGWLAIGGQIRMFLPPGNPRTASALYDLCFGLRQRRNVEDYGFSVTANLFVSKAILGSVGLFRTDVFSGGDVEWCARARQRGVYLEYAPDAIVYHPVRSNWKALRSKVLRIAGGVSDSRYRAAVKSGHSRKKGYFAKMAQIIRVVESRDLRSWRERVAVLLMAFVVSVWGLEGRVRSRLRKQSPR